MALDVEIDTLTETSRVMLALNDASVQVGANK